MSDPSLKLLTAAKHYCLEQGQRWTEIYSAMVSEGRDRRGHEYTDEALTTFPRYQVLNALFVGTEEFDPENLPDSATLKEALLQIALFKDNFFTKDGFGEIGNKAVEEERMKFADFIERMDIETILEMNPFPYRRVLSAEEVKALWGRIYQRWKADGTYWYPLADRTDASLFAFHTEDFDAHLSPDLLRAIMRGKGIERVFELREYGEENYQMELKCWEPSYNGAEGFWVSDKLDWILYASHEGSMTTGGWLTDEVLGSWPAGRDHQWYFMKGGTEKIYPD